MNDSFMLACTASRWSGDIRECRWCASPLTGRQQRWCSTACADSASSQHWWSWASKSARRDRGACLRCGSAENLEAHHIVAALGRHNQFSCIHHADNIEVLCRVCHDAEHAKRNAYERGFLDAPTQRKRVPGFEDAQLSLRVHDPRDLAQPR